MSQIVPYRYCRCYYDVVSSGRCDCICMDSDRDYGIDYVHSGESVPCSLARALHVWCGCKLFRTYQEFMRYILSVIFSIFCFVIPVYAVPDDFLLENSDHYDTAIYYDLSDTNDIYQGSFDSIVRSPSINPNVPFQYLGFSIIDNGNDSFDVSINFEGSLPAGYNSFSVAGKLLSDNSNYSGSMSSPDYIRTFNDTNRSILYVYLRDTSNTNPTQLLGRYNIIVSDSLGQTIGTDVPTATYLSQVTEIFAWLLSSIGTLIIFILGNPFLAVMLMLFLAGTIISFFVRIRR